MRIMDESTKENALNSGRDTASISWWIAALFILFEKCSSIAFDCRDCLLDWDIIS